MARRKWQKGPMGLGEKLENEQHQRRPRMTDVPRWRKGPGQRRQVTDRLEAYAAPTFGSLPERIVERWLIDQGLDYEREIWTLGGAALGGARLDFVVYNLIPGQRLVIRTMGTWVHASRGLMDAHQLARLLGYGYAVVDIWDGALYDALQAGNLSAFMYREIMRQS